MADQPNITRRLALKAFPFIGATTAIAIGSLTDILPAAAEQTDDYVAIPRVAYDRIKTWQAANRASVATANATPNLETRNPMQWDALRDANSNLMLARDRMIFALHRV